MDYFNFEIPIKKEDIPLDWCIEEGGPFNKKWKSQHGLFLLNLWRVEKNFLLILEKSFLLK